MARLADGAESLLASLAKAQAELEWVGQRLEEEFARKHKAKEANPYNLVQRINKLRRELPSVQDECRQLMAARQAVVDAAKQQLTGNVEMLVGLQRRAGLQQDAASEETVHAFKIAIREHEAGISAQTAAVEVAVDRQQLNEDLVYSTLG